MPPLPWATKKTVAEADPVTPAVTPSAPPRTKAAALSFQCPSCGGSVQVRAVGSSISVVCGSCASVIDAKDPNHAVLSKAAVNMRIQPLIPLGTRGKLRGTLWEVIGFMQRVDGSGQYNWREYLLFNPTQGFRWLLESQGHWSYVIPLHERPKKGSGNTASVLGKSYRHFLTGQVSVQYVLGEFYWRVKVGDSVQAMDYVNPPEVLSIERDKSEETYSLGEYLLPQEVRSAFSITANMPAPIGVAPNQPSAFDGNSDLRGYWGAFAAILFLIQLLSLMFSSSKVLDVSSFNWEKNAATASFSTPSFEVTKTSGLQIRLQAPVSNNWFEISGDLVNEADGDTEEFELGVEYYSGYDSDGSWSEGSQQGSKVLSSIAPGKYHLNLQGSSEMERMSFSVETVQGTALWSNFVLIFSLLSAYPAFMLWRRHVFETARWSGSDYAGGDDE